jgi:putative transposase
MNWPHAPQQWVFESGVYMVTAGTYRKQPHLNASERRDFFVEALFSRAAEFGWMLHAWTVLSNHYHFIAASPRDPKTLRRFLGKLHMTTSKLLNELDGHPGRKVWFQYWDSHITFERSYLARLNSVHQNPVHHGVADNAENYAWCSAAWFARSAPAGFVATVKSFKTDKLKIPDEF